VEIGSSKLSTMYAVPDRLGVEGFTYLLILAPRLMQREPSSAGMRKMIEEHERQRVPTDD
jgi:hypothetical protein